MDSRIHATDYKDLYQGEDDPNWSQYHPNYKDTLDIAPGERYELLIHLDQVGGYVFHDHQEQDTTNNGSYPGGMMPMINVNSLNGSNPVSMKSMMASSG